MNHENVHTGVVVSDLHWFARRSQAPQLMSRLHDAAADARAIVLNGDTFDFNWTTRPSLEASVEEAARWIEDLCRRHPRARVCFVIGNHDYYRPFLERLPGLSERLPNFEYHPHLLRIGRCLFLHGDCVNCSRLVDGVPSVRRLWYKGSHRSNAMGRIYTRLVLMRVILLTHLIAFPRRRVLRRLQRWIEHNQPDLLKEVDDIYFGHTHLPFRDEARNGLRFHNTGSAIATMGFNLMTFQYEDS